MVYLFDPVTSMYASDYTAQGLERNVEFFYWTPDMPEMFKTQAHVLLNALKANPECVDLLPIWRNDRIEKNKLTGEPMRRWVKKILYPTYDYTSLQIDKNTSPLLVPEWFSWFYDNPHSRDIMQPHVSAVRSYHNVIDPRFFVVRDGEVHDYYCYYSRLFHIGDLT
jgi:hypothetical protein